MTSLLSIKSVNNVEVQKLSTSKEREYGSFFILTKKNCMNSRSLYIFSLKEEQKCPGHCLCFMYAVILLPR